MATTRNLHTHLQSIWCTRPPVFEMILSHLPGYAAAILLAWLDVPDKDNIKYWQKKYVSPLKDLPEHAAWIEKMIARNHAVFLIGTDTKRLMERLENPRSYWKPLQRFTDDKPFRLWLAVRVSRNTHKARQKQLRVRGYANTPVLKDGSVYFGRHPAKLGKDEILTESNVILPSEILGELGGRCRAPCWAQSTKANANNIIIAFAQGHALDKMEEDVTPRMSLCPLQVEERDARDVLGGKHSSVGGRNRCSEITPGAEVTRVSLGKANVGFQLPYICLNTGEQSTSREVPEILDDEGFRPDDYAFINRLRCMDQATGPSIRPELQGIPWPRD